MLDNLQITELECGKLRMTPEPHHAHMQARNFKTLKTKVSATIAAIIKDPDRREKIGPQC